VHKQDAEPFQDPRWCNPPHAYHNAGVWPFIGGHLVAACVAAGMHDTASALLQRLIEANRRSADAAIAWGFHEWLRGDTGAPGGAALQAWSASSFLLAVASVERRRTRWGV
jgi:glycogen debranching enzyme